MSMADMGRDITEHNNIDRVFPQETFMTLDDNGWTGAVLDDVSAIVFPKGKLMWPVYRLEQKHLFERGCAVRSVKDTSYSPLRIFTVCADERGAWVFVLHEYNNQRLVGFVASLDGTLVQPFGNVPPVEVGQWISQNFPIKR